MARIAILGASGHVGATFVERMLANGKHEVRPFIHSSGNAGRLARLGIALEKADLLDLSSLREALDGCTHVVNCARGFDDTLVTGMRQLLKVCGAARIERLVHLSSILVYGDRPAPEAAHEVARPNPSPGYGLAKFRQDKMVQQACRRGLPSVILCIPNVSGAHSVYLPEIVGAIRDRSLPLVEGGRMPINLVDVRNVAVALELALFCEQADGKRIYITDGGEPTWHDLVEGLSPLVLDAEPLDEISIDEAQRLLQVNEWRITAIKRAAHWVLGLEKVREIVRQDPILAVDYRRMVAKYHVLPDWIHKWLESIARQAPAAGGGVGKRRYSSRLIEHQLRNDRRSIDRAREILGYSPHVDMKQSLADYCRWYASVHGLDGPFADLYGELVAL